MASMRELCSWGLCCCLGFAACGKSTSGAKPSPPQGAAAGEAGAGASAESGGGQGGIDDIGSDGGGTGENGGASAGEQAASGAGGTEDAGGAGGANGGGGADCDPPSGLVAWWPGNGNAIDVIGGSDGSMKQGATFAPALFDRAFSLDGDNDYVDFGNTEALQVSSGDFSLDAWVRFDAVPAVDMSIVDKMSASGVNLDGWRLLKQEDNHFWFCFGGGALNRCFEPEFTLFSTTLAAADTWFHLAVVKNASSFSLYVNGEREDTRSPVPAFVDTNAASLLVGSYVLQGSHLAGLVDEVQLYNRALSAGEVRGLFDLGKLGQCH